MADPKIRVIGEDQASRELEKIQQKLGGFAGSWTELNNKIQVAEQALQVFTGTFEKAFEMGRQGAVFQQTTESFDGLLQRVGAAPDLLAELQTASRGTVDDLTLMGSTLTLAAGASDGFAKDLMNATPQLLNIAKAASKLNPTLGDTTYLYQSIALGIKRGSPLILDNLGITLKLEEAYKAYADQLGKTADKLSSTEQKQAILNAVLKQGDQLIAQAGGNTKSAVDDFDRLQASTTNLANKFKEDLVPVLADAASALELILTQSQKLKAATMDHEAEVRASSASWQEYAEEMKRALEVQGFMVSITDGQIRVFGRNSHGATELTDKYNFLTEATFNATRAAAQYADTLDQAAGGYEGVAGGNATLNASFRMTEEAVTAANQALEESREKMAELREEMAATAVEAGISGALQEAWNKYKEKAAEVTAENAAINAEIQKLIAEGVDPASDEIQTLTERMGDNVTEMEKMREATNRASLEFIYQKAAANMSADASLMLGRALGLVSEADYTLTKTVLDLTAKLDANSDAMVDGSEVTQDYLDYIQGLGNQLLKVTADQDGYTAEIKDHIKELESATARTKDLGAAQAALSAGLSGNLVAAQTRYQDTLRQTAEDNAKLREEYEKLAQTGGATTEALAKLDAQMMANNQRQQEAREALRQATAEMIFQQASAGLGAAESLTLARAMGLLSEKDYQVMNALMQLREQFDRNADGMITAAEGARQYTQAVIALYNAVERTNSALTASPLNGDGGAVGMGGYQGNGIYTGGPGEWIGPGPLSNPAPTVNNVNLNYAPTLSTGNEAALQQALAPIVNRIIAGR